MGENIQLKKGAWTSEEDELLSNYINTYGRCTWSKLPTYAGLKRCGKSCRLRWMNYLRPDLKRGAFTKEEEELIVNLHEKLGTSWSKIAASLPGRSDNEIKNYWHTHLKEQPRKTSRKQKKAKSVQKPSKPDNIPFLILESSSVLPQKSPVVDNEVASTKDPGRGNLSSDADVFAWPELMDLEEMLKAYDEIVISSKPYSVCERKDDITSVLDFPESPQKSDAFSPPSIDNSVMENLATDGTAVSSEPSQQSECDDRNDQYMIEEEVPLMESMDTKQTTILSDPYLDIDPNFLNALYQDSGFASDLW